MGFSTSAVVAIFTASLIYMASIFYPLTEMSYHKVLEAEKNSNERWNEKLNTKIVITNWTEDGKLTVYNNGSVTLDSSKINVILNGTWNPPVSVNPGGIWPPKTPIDVDIGATGGRVKIIAANGAADYITK
jgi:archaellum component FlaF (FlaF/FlaG flagellin family)